MEQGARGLSPGGDTNGSDPSRLASDLRAGRSPAGGCGKLPGILSSFVGRREERAEVVGMLGTSPLVSLVGGPGVGKTRLALESAAAIKEDYLDGAWLVQLDSITDPALLPVAVASTLGVRERSGSGLADSLLAELRHKQLLLVLDNCEHLIEACASHVQLLLESCASIRVLTTSREPLRLSGELVRRISPLDVPPATIESPESLVAHDAVRLFIERAVTAQAGFEVNEQTSQIVAEICRRLDGIPLAIELAAARTEMFSLEEILKRLDDRFRLLKGGTRAVRAQHKTLLTAIDSSYGLLPPPEATLLRRLSIFAGGWTVEGAEAVCSDRDVPQEAVMDLIGALVRKSMVCVDGRHTETRYRLLETIRDYSNRRLEEAGEKADLSARYCRWCVDLAERAESELSGDSYAEWLERISTEQDNLRAAFEWALSSDQTELALRLSGSLAMFRFMQGHSGEGRRWLTSALEADGSEARDHKSRALWGAAFLAGAAGDLDQAIPLARECQAMAAEGDDPALRSRTRHLLGVLSVYQSPLDALPLLENNVALARREGGLGCLTSSLASLGSACILVGDNQAARNHLEECLGLSRRGGARVMEAGALTGLGHAALAEGDYATAESLLHAARVVARDVGELDEDAVALGWLGELARGRGQYSQARAFIDEALAVARTIDLPILVARCLCFSGRVELAQGDLGGARAQFGSSLPIAKRVGLTYLVARCLLGFGEIFALEGEWSKAQAMVDEALSLARAKGDRQAVAAGWYALANLARRQGTIDRADSLCQRAITLQNEIHDLAGIVASLEMWAALHGPGTDAIGLFAAAQAARERGGYARPPVASEAYESDLRSAREALTSDQFTHAWAEGSSLSVQEAIASASRRRRSGADHRHGGISLTPAELDVARLAAQGLTNREIGRHLFVSPRTAGAHLTHVFAKLGIHSRSELTKFSLSDLKSDRSPREQAGLPATATRSEGRDDGAMEAEQR